MPHLVIAVIPPLAALWIFYKLDRFEAEPFKVLLRVFFLGCVSTLPAIALEITFEPLFSHSIFLGVLVGISLIEELVKFIAVRIGVYSTSDFNEPFDGVVYCVTASMGFAVVENIGYVLQSPEGQENAVGLLRAFTAIPLHTLTGVLMGHYMGLAKFNSPKEWIYLAYGILSAIALHAIYDYFLFIGQSNLVIFSIFALIIGLFISRQMIQTSLNASPFRMNGLTLWLEEYEECKPIIHPKEADDSENQKNRKVPSLNFAAASLASATVWGIILLEWTVPAMGIVAFISAYAVSICISIYSISLPMAYFSSMLTDKSQKVLFEQFKWIFLLLYNLIQLAIYA